MNSPEQDKALDEIITTLQQWRAEGVPDRCLVRVWKEDTVGATHITEVSQHLPLTLIQDFLRHWTGTVHEQIRVLRKAVAEPSVLSA